MPAIKCCVGGCFATNKTHRLYCMPSNDNLRNLWMSLLVPTNSELLGLTKTQLLSKRVCERHFDETQFDAIGVRIRYSYPCLLTEREILLSFPLTTEEYNVRNEHNYSLSQEPHDSNTPGELIVLKGIKGDNLSQEHLYTLPSTQLLDQKVKIEVDDDL